MRKLLWLSFQFLNTTCLHLTQRKMEHGMRAHKWWPIIDGVCLLRKAYTEKGTMARLELVSLYDRTISQCAFSNMDYTEYLWLSYWILSNRVWLNNLVLSSFMPTEIKSYVKWKEDDTRPEGEISLILLWAPDLKDRLMGSILHPTTTCPWNIEILKKIK